MKFKAPHTYALIFFIIMITAALTWIVPSGEFERAEKKLSNGSTKTLVVPNSYKRAESNPQGPLDVLKAPLKGLKDASSVVAFVLIIGGAFGILRKTGAVEAGLSRAVRGLKGKELLIIPVSMLLFGLGGTSMGMCEETIPFYMVFIPLMLSLGYDSLTGFMIILLGAGTGVAASTVNPFSVGIAQAIAELAPGSGLPFRVVQFVVLMTISIAFVMWHAYRVKKNPEKSPMFKLDKKNKEHFIQHAGDADKIDFDWAHALILIGLAVGIGIMVFGIIKYLWYITEASMVFFAIGLFAGLIAAISKKMNINQIADAFAEGCMDLAYAAVIIGLARGILVIAQDGKIIDTSLNAMALALNGLPKGVFTTLMLAFQNLVAVAVPSSSGHAALTMSVMSPLGDLIGINRQIIVTAYQYGTGLTNLITPTAGTLMAALAIAKIPWDKWAKFILPLFGILWVTVAVFLIIGLGIY